MPIVDASGNRCDRALRLHFRLLHRITFDVQDHIQRTQKIFGKTGIYLEVASAECVQMDRRSHGRLVVVESSFRKDTSSPEQTEIYERFAVHGDLMAVTVFIVFALRPVGWSLPGHSRVAGSANHIAARPAVFLADDITPFALAHELGHVLMNTRNDHTEGPTDVMRSGLVPNSLPKTIAEATFQDAQIALMRKSSLLRPC